MVSAFLVPKNPVKTGTKSNSSFREKPLKIERISQQKAYGMFFDKHSHPWGDVHRASLTIRQEDPGQFVQGSIHCDNC
jgi:hypothetical protein